MIFHGAGGLIVVEQNRTVGCNQRDAAQLSVAGLILQSFEVLLTGQLDRRLNIGRLFFYPCFIPPSSSSYITAKMRMDDKTRRSGRTGKCSKISFFSFRLSDTVSTTADSLDETAGILKFLAQGADVDIHSAGLTVKVITPEVA